MLIYALMGVVALITAGLYYWGRRRDPVTALLLAVATLGITLIGVSAALLSTKLCPWWMAG
jgi:hypothetical protein